MNGNLPEMVRCSDLTLNEALYPRHQMDEGNIRKLTEARRAGVDLPPVIVDRRTRQVVDGFHRVKTEIKLAGEEALIGIEWRDYENEAAIFADAMLLNSRHGQSLAAYDRVRCLILARKLGIPDRETAARLQITVETAERLVLERTAIGPDAELVPLKFTDVHMSGRTLSADQLRGDRLASGMSLVFSVNQLLNALENDLVEWSNEGLVVRLETLLRTLAAALPARKAAT